MPFTSPPSEVSRLSLGSALRAEGWSVVGTLVVNQSGAGTVSASGLMPNATNRATSRTYHRIAKPCTKVRLAFGNWMCDGSLGEVVAPNDFKVEVVIERLGTGINKRDGVRRSVTWDGKPTVTIGPSTRWYAISDEIDLPFTQAEIDAGESELFVVACGTVLNSGLLFTGQWSLGGGTASEALNIGEGNAVGNLINSTADWSANSRANSLCPIAIYGYTGATPAFSLGMMGDSETTTQDDGVHGSGGGSGIRAALGSSLLAFDPLTVNPNCGYIQLAKGGEELEDVTAGVEFARRIEILSACYAVISYYGANNLGGLAQSAATFMALQATLAEAVLRAGATYFGVCCLPPRADSTDNWTTLAGQKNGANPLWGSSWSDAKEAQRIALNTAYRNGTFAALLPASLRPRIRVVDLADVLGMSLAGAPDPAGPLWLVEGDLGGISGSIVDVTGATNRQFLSNLPGGAVNTHRGWTFRMTSGPAAGSQSGIQWQQADSFIHLGSNLAAAPEIGNTWTAYSALTSQDGTHPSTYGHLLESQAVLAAFPEIEAA